MVKKWKFKKVVRVLFNEPIPVVCVLTDNFYEKFKRLKINFQIHNRRVFYNIVHIGNQNNAFPIGRYNGLRIIYFFNGF